MKILISEKLSPHRFKTPEGYLICTDSILARTGKQTYKRGEVFGMDCNDSDADVEVDRRPEEVFSEKTMASFENKPLCVEHPDCDVNAHNHNEYAVGFVRDVHKGTVDGQDVVLGTLVVTDAKTIEEIENGEHTDLSCGYDCDIEDDDHPQQRNIRGNHVALCQQGRAGIARIVDSTNDGKKLPANVRNNIQKFLAHKSTFIRNRDYDISEFVQEFERMTRLWAEFPLKIVREKIDGWKKMDDGMMRKDYFFSIEGYDDKFIVSLYAKPNTYETTELNAFFTDSIKKNVNDAVYEDYIRKIEEASMDERILEDIRRGIKAEYELTKSEKDRLIMKVNALLADIDRMSDSKFDDSIKDEGVKVWQIHAGYAIVPSKYWKQYGKNAFIDRREDSLDSARYVRSSLERNDRMTFVIIDCNDNKYKMVDSKMKDVKQIHKKIHEQIVYVMQSDVDKNLYFYIGENYSMKEGSYTYQQYDMEGMTPDELRKDLEANGWHKVAKGPAKFIDEDPYKESTEGLEKEADKCHNDMCRNTETDCKDAKKFRSLDSALRFIKQIRSSKINDRLAPSQYAALRRLGYNETKWKNMTSEQASKIIAEARQKKNQTSTNKQKQEKAKETKSKTKRLSPEEHAKKLESEVRQYIDEEDVKFPITEIKSNSSINAASVTLHLRSQAAAKRFVEYMRSKGKHFELGYGGTAYITESFDPDVKEADIIRSYLDKENLHSSEIRYVESENENRNDNMYVYLPSGTSTAKRRKIANEIANKLNIQYDPYGDLTNVFITKYGVIYVPLSKSSAAKK